MATISMAWAKKRSRSAHAAAPAAPASAAALAALAPCTATIVTSGIACAARTCVALMPPAPMMPIRMRRRTALPRRRALLDAHDLDAAVPHLVAVVLQQDMAVLRLAEPRDVLELALRDGGAQRRRVELVLEHLLAVEDVLDVRAADDHFAGVPLAGGVHRPIVRREDVVQRRGLTVRADLRVGVPLVVYQLVLVPDRRGLILEHEVLDAAVAALRDPPFPSQVELIVGLCGDDVALTLGVAGAGLRDGEHPVLHLPAGVRRVGLLVAAPAVEGLAIEELHPAAFRAIPARPLRRLRRQRDEGRAGEQDGERTDQMPGHVIHLYR